MKKRAKSLLALLLAFVMMFGTSLMAFAETGVENSAYTSGLCEHHTEHDDDCGYQPAVEGTPCSHVCSEESGCIPETLNCTHEHDDDCGYQPAVEGTPCGYVCELCESEDPEQKDEQEDEQKDGQKTFTVAQVEAMIDDLSAVEYVKTLDPEEDAETLEEIYLQAADAAYAFGTLSDEDQEKVSNLDKLMELHEWFNGGVATMDESGTYPSGKFANKAGVADAFTWKLYNDGGNLKLEITGTGDMPYWPSGNAPWNYYRDSIKAVSIGNGVTSIGNNAFYNCMNLTSVKLPAGLETIGSDAFNNCNTALESITIPASVKTIGASAFNQCIALETVIFDGKSQLTELGATAFQFCSALESITIPAGVTTIGAATFDSCTALKSITIPAGVKTIGGGAFQHCSALESITIPASVTEIGGSAFNGCTGLTTVTFAGTAPPATIASTAFSGCNIKTINVPSGSETAYSKLTESLLPKQPSDSSSKPTKEEYSGSAKEEYSGSAKEEHSHSYSWVTVQAPGVGQDGIEEYRCSCGAVADRSVITATQAAVSGMMDAIENAPTGGNISFDSGRFYTMSDKIIKKLAERSDVVTEITFEYQGIAYKMTVPAGIDYTAILADDERFYGYFYFAQLIGATIETR